MTGHLDSGPHEGTGLGREPAGAASAAEERLCPIPWGDCLAVADVGQVMELIISPSSPEGFWTESAPFC